MTTPNNIITAWIAHQEAIPGHVVADGLRDLVSSTGASPATLTHKRLRQWERGERTPPPIVQREMAREVVQDAALMLIEALGLPPSSLLVIPDDTLDAVADMLTPTPAR